MSILESAPKIVHATWCRVHPVDNLACVSIEESGGFSAFATAGPGGITYTIEAYAIDVSPETMDDLIARLVALRERTR